METSHDVKVEGLIHKKCGIHKSSAASDRQTGGVGAGCHELRRMSHRCATHTFQVNRVNADELRRGDSVAMAVHEHGSLSWATCGALRMHRQAGVSAGLRRRSIGCCLNWKLELLLNPSSVIVRYADDCVSGVFRPLPSLPRSAGRRENGTAHCP